MEKLNAITGWMWIKEGGRLFRKQPAELLTLFFAYMFLSMGVTLIPLVGEYLPLILIPVYSMAFMQACRQIEQDKRVYPNLLLTGFRSPAFGNLLLLGVLYLLAAGIAVLASSLVDGGEFLSFVIGQTPVETKNIQEGTLLPGMLVTNLVYLAAILGLWYAAPLIAWKRMSVGKAVFYSFFAVKNASKAFTLYSLVWFLLIMVIAMVSVIIALIVGQAIVVVLIVVPASVVLTVIIYTSFYPTYVQIFGRPDEQE